jgi:hypothetical protein
MAVRVECCFPPLEAKPPITASATKPYIAIAATWRPRPRRPRSHSHSHNLRSTLTSVAIPYHRAHESRRELTLSHSSDVTDLPDDRIHQPIPVFAATASATLSRYRLRPLLRLRSGSGHRGEAGGRAGGAATCIWLVCVGASA